MARWLFRAPLFALFALLILKEGLVNEVGWYAIVAEEGSFGFVTDGGDFGTL